MSSEKLAIPVNETDHHRGSLGSLAVLLEYADFECLQSANAFPELEAVKREFGTSLCFAYRHFPLTEFHPQAELAAMAAEAAAQQDNFWQMHHLLFQHYDSLSRTNILTLAEALELDMQRFQKDWNKEFVRQRVAKDFAGGLRSGVSETPTLFLNGELVHGPATFANLVPLIADKLSLGPPLQN